jgi:mycothiol system anti-sigma-R factor
VNDCARILSLLDVYLDDEATAETNVMVQQHVEQCEACARQLQAAHHLRASMRDALRHDRAPASLHQRVGALLTPPRPSLASFIREWIVPATATAIVAWIVLPWRPVEPDIYPLMAVGEHVACALDRAVPPRDVSYYAADTSMPLIPGAGGKVRILEAHACGQQMDYLLHMILEEGGTKASIFITRAGEGAERIFRPRRSGDFEVSQVRTTRHRAFVVIDRTHARALREWRAPTVQRLQHFLKQVEGT